MNTKIVRSILSKMLLVESTFFIIPLLLSFYYSERWEIKKSYLITIGLLLATSFILSIRTETKRKFYTKEGMIIVSLSWILMSFFGALPFYLSGEIPYMVDAFFEATSGLTTTGASILMDIESMAKSMLFWRSFSHLVGGMGVLVFALAVLPKSTNQTVHLMRAEVPGPTFGKLVSKATSNARILYKMYLLMTGILIIILLAEGMPLFDACVNAFSTAGTGGFAVKNNSIAAYSSPLIEMTLAVSMVIFGMNFNFYYIGLRGKFRDIFKSEEAKWYVGIIIAATVLIFLNTDPADNPLIKIKDAFFSVTSVITTTGFSTVDYGIWPLFSQCIILFLMFTGGCSGSTAGGFKISRFAILFKSGIREIRRSVNPKRVLSISFEGKSLDRDVITSVKDYLIVHFACVALLMFVVSLNAPDFLSAFTASLASFNNIGPGLGEIGPSSSFVGVSPFNKVLLSFAMLAGRLEIFPVIILLAPNTWRK